MSNTYTPTVEEAREEYQSTGDGLDFKRREEFDRMIASVRAEALREAADDLERLRNEPVLVRLDVTHQGYYTGIRSGMRTGVEKLRTRAEQENRDD